MTSNKANVTLCGIVLGLTIFAFVWLFATANVATTNTSEIAEKYKTVEIDSINQDIMDLLSERQNVSGMPIPEPTSKMGKDNPFSPSK